MRVVNRGSQLRNVVALIGEVGGLQRRGAGELVIGLVVIVDINVPVVNGVGVIALDGLTGLLIDLDLEVAHSGDRRVDRDGEALEVAFVVGGEDRVTASPV